MAIGVGGRGIVFDSPSCHEIFLEKMSLRH